MILELCGLKKQYNGKTVLDIDRMEIQEGRITAVIGPSGAGKSTLLTLVNGIEVPSEGKIVFSGCEYSAGKKYSLEAQRQMVMVFQKPAVFNATVYDNIASGLKIRNVEKSAVRRRVEEALELIGLKEMQNQRAHTLSGGEAQRVALARAMVLQPKLLLLDEPTANLDPANVILMENLIRYARDQYQSTVLMVTHNMFQAKRLADSVAFMLNGAIVEYGDTLEVFDQPKHDKTRSFIQGKMIY